MTEEEKEEEQRLTEIPIGLEPECTTTEEEKEEIGIECEFENRDGSWWCTTHNCSA